MKFPRPSFKILLEHYQTSSLSVHDCPRIYTKDTEGGRASVNTCAIRLSEALVLASGLARSRTEIGQLTTRGGSGQGFLLGKYGYKNLLCPHGIARGARDLAYFLQEQWGKPSRVWNEPREAPGDLMHQTGVIAFIKLLEHQGVTGHMDLWNGTRAVGAAYFKSEKVWFWQLE